ncbi:MAG: hypothetical protein U1C57_03590, partial [Candidatus Doudnabacteria bacterium]|nr:hypothetical protein [Candidatus Doudnabacteria bacterium]
MRSFDIKAPQKAKGADPVKRPQMRKSRGHYRKTLFTGIALVVLLAVIVFYVMPQARADIKLRTEPVTRDLEVRVDSRQQTADAANLVIPGEFLQSETTKGRKFAATGKKDVGQKASGFVYIYNFSKTTLVLKAQTTVLNVGDREYLFVQDVGNIRPTALIGLEDQEVDQTSLIAPVPVVAAGPGPAYNLAEGARIEITNEVFGAQPKALYAVAAEGGLTGGVTREIKVVTENDILSSFDILNQELINETRNELNGSKPNSKLLDKAASSEIIEKYSSASPSQEASEFESAIKVRLKALAYDESEVLRIIRERISKLLPKNKILSSDAQFRLNSQFKSIDLASGSGILTNHFEGKASYQLDKEELLEKIKGKSPDEIREILLSRPEIESVEIKLSPFWVKKMPRFGKRITLELT